MSAIYALSKTSFPLPLELFFWANATEEEMQALYFFPLFSFYFFLANATEEEMQALSVNID